MPGGFLPPRMDGICIHVFTAVVGIPVPYHVRLSLVFERPQADFYVGALAHIPFTPWLSRKYCFGRMLLWKRFPFEGQWNVHKSQLLPSHFFPIKASFKTWNIFTGGTVKIMFSSIGIAVSIQRRQTVLHDVTNVGYRGHVWKQKMEGSFEAERGSLVWNSFPRSEHILVLGGRQLKQT